MNRFISVFFLCIVLKNMVKNWKTFASLHQEVLLNGFTVYRACNLISETKIISNRCFGRI